MQEVTEEEVYNHYVQRGCRDAKRKMAAVKQFIEWVIKSIPRWSRPHWLIIQIPRFQGLTG